MDYKKTAASWSDMYSRKRRYRRQAYFFIFLIAAYFVFVAAVWIVIYSPLFRIKDIEIVGNKNVSSNDVMTMIRADIYRGSLIKRILGMGNILIWPGNFSENILKFYPELKSASVQKNYLKKKVKIIVEEKQPFGVWCFQRTQTNTDDTQTSTETISFQSILNPYESASSCFWFDSDGIIFKRAIEAEGNLIISVNDYSQKNVGLNRKILPNRFVSDIFSIFRAVSQSGLSVKEMRLNDLSLEEMEVDTYDGPSVDSPAESLLKAGASASGLPSDYGGVSKAGPKIYFSLRFSADNVPEVIKSLKEKATFGNLQYVDFRVENRMYYK